MEKNTQTITPAAPVLQQLSDGIQLARIYAQHVGILRPVAVQAYMEHYEHLWHDAGRWYLEQNFSSQRLAAELSDPDAAFYLAYLHGEPVGFLKLNLHASLHGDPDTSGLELERIYITKAGSGKGVGTQLLHFTFRQAAELHKHYVWLKAMDTSSGPIAFYQKHGFEPCGTHRLPFPVMKEEYRGMVIMKWSMVNGQSGLMGDAGAKQSFNERENMQFIQSRTKE